MVGAGSVVTIVYEGDDDDMADYFAMEIKKAQAELDKAATLDAPNAGRYYYNLGAILTNVNQLEPASIAFKKATSSRPSGSTSERLPPDDDE